MTEKLSTKRKLQTTKRKLITDVFDLVSGKENEIKSLNEVMAVLGVQRKQSVTERIKYSPAEVEAVENIFRKYGVTQNIWTDATN